MSLKAVRIQPYQLAHPATLHQGVDTAIRQVNYCSGCSHAEDGLAPFVLDRRTRAFPRRPS
jgi:hypothetical protein